MNRLSNDRNGTTIFASRTQKNLDFIWRHAQDGEDVHPVTQAILALLGIVVFPWETSAFNHLKSKNLPVLATQGWPNWRMAGSRRVVSMNDLIHVLRNAIAHGSIEFDSDSRDPSSVTISFINVPEGADASDWVGTIMGDQLIEFCACFSAAIEDAVG